MDVLTAHDAVVFDGECSIIVAGSLTVSESGLEFSTDFQKRPASYMEVADAHEFDGIQVYEMSDAFTGLWRNL